MLVYMGASAIPPHKMHHFPIKYVGKRPKNTNKINFSQRIFRKRRKRKKNEPPCPPSDPTCGGQGWGKVFWKIFALPLPPPLSLLGHWLFRGHWLSFDAGYSWDTGSPADLCAPRCELFRVLRPSNKIYHRRTRREPM